MAAPLIDVYSPLSHKVQIGATADGAAGLAVSWSGRHRRRLNAYIILAAYLRNVAREFLSQTDADERAAHREYGDPASLVAAIRSAVLGEDVTFTVEGSTVDPGPEPEDPGDEASDSDREAFALELADWTEANAEHEAAASRQEWLDRWIRDERVLAKVVQAETNAVGLGDAVYRLDWSNRHGRPRLRQYDPGFYFPADDDDGGDDEYPDRVHLAWEYDTADGTRMVRRITYALELADEWRPPYLEDGERPATRRCYLTDMVWRLDALGGVTDPDAFPEGSGVAKTNADGLPLARYDLGIDFVPVVHVPNTLTDDWGESSLLRVASLLDDLAATDTDAATAAATTGGPVITASGSVPPGEVTTYGPNQVLWTADGTMGVLETSDGLRALGEYIDRLLDRLSTVRQVPASVLGRAQVTREGVAGITVLLSYGPFRNLVGEMRLAREDKYRLLLKFAQRLAIVGGSTPGTVPAGALEPGSVPLPAAIAFGTFLPTDLEALRALLVGLVDAGILSRRTALRIMVEAGLDVPDVDAEADAAQHEDFAGAGELATALGGVDGENEAWLYLGLTPPEDTPAGGPAPVVPPGAVLPPVDPANPLGDPIDPEADPEA